MGFLPVVFLQYYDTLVFVAQQVVEKEQQRLFFLLWEEQCPHIITNENKLEKPTAKETEQK